MSDRTHIFTRGYRNMSELKGYAGQLLDVDLSTGTINKVPLDPPLVRDYIGGRALGIRLITEEYGDNYADIDPLGEEAILALMAAPYAGFGAPMINAAVKSPQHGPICAWSAPGD